MRISRQVSLQASLLGLIVLVFAIELGTASAADRGQFRRFDTVTTLGTTVPANGDVNPYGVARIPRTTGTLVEDRFIVSNFNNGANLQGTGTTIVQIAANGSSSLFAQIDASKVDCPGGIGLTTALVALRSGFVIVGSLPTTDGTSSTAQAGCLIVLDSNGSVVEVFSGHNINGPWDMTAVDSDRLVALFVTNVLNGTVAAQGNTVSKGTVVRLLLQIPKGLPPQLIASTVIAADFPERTDPAALVIGPTGVAFDDEDGVLYVADSLENRIAAIPNALSRMSNAGIGRTVSQGRALNDPLGLSLTPNHRLVVANGNDGNMIEVNPESGKQLAVVQADSTGGPPPGAGALFGLIAVSDGVYFVDDASNTFNLLH